MGCMLEPNPMCMGIRICKNTNKTGRFPIREVASCYGFVFAFELMSGFAEVWTKVGEVRGETRGEAKGRVQGIVETCKLNSFSLETAIDSVLKLISGISREKAETQVKKYWNRPREVANRVKFSQIILDFQGGSETALLNRVIQ